MLAKIAERPEPDRALSLDALSSVAYGPEAIVLVLAAAERPRGLLLATILRASTDVVICTIRYRLRTR